MGGVEHCKGNHSIKDLLEKIEEKDKMIRSSLMKKIGIRFLIARLSGSHELAEVFEPKTWLIDMKYKP